MRLESMQCLVRGFDCYAVSVSKDIETGGEAAQQISFRKIIERRPDNNRMQGAVTSMTTTTTTTTSRATTVIYTLYVLQALETRYCSLLKTAQS